MCVIITGLTISLYFPAFWTSEPIYTLLFEDPSVQRITKPIYEFTIGVLHRWQLKRISIYLQNFMFEITKKTRKGDWV